ncbi:hypothetical protein DYBT9275_06001 [Dyadobacter sp. CECT 9275]|uniref:4-alpha-glucanotransferase n=1 Tax=Dyadobacter helix TaxID=2822344 RepID=A0A916JHA1_9BACT|nr:malto-oligosyltrehalose synthase [Dyadobacter sp. CECT 9275]CAG5018437.1 hypothetical protein DYBT9275_06001 [Dyadobacter sp. CECT 9275]
MNNLAATYRLQFRKEFSFKDLKKIIPYLQKLGVSTIYASPVFKSTSGSSHGYDGVNPNQIDPEIGTEQDLLDVSGILKENQMSWLQDIVPNHMAFHSENPWLMDVLEKGMQSLYLPFFDIAWNSRLYHGKLMVPFLSADLDEILENDQVALKYQSSRLVIRYEEAVFPLNPQAYLLVLDTPEMLSNQSLAQIVSQIGALNQEQEAHTFTEMWHEILLQLQSILGNGAAMEQVSNRLEGINADRQLLRQVIDMQNYALCHWQKTEHQINFRRFFTVNGLICLNIQNEEVFGRYHVLIKSLIDKGVIQGLRIDHIDGLYNPSRYLQHLRQLAGDDTSIMVEKILKNGESLPKSWPVEGTTGYEFLAAVNNVLTNKASESTFTEYYQNLVGESKPVTQLLLEKKAHILYEHMGGELENLYQLFVELNLVEEEALHSVGKESLKSAIGEFLVHCPVYRYYGNVFPLDNTEMAAVSQILDEVKNAHPELEEAVGILADSLLNRPAEENDDYKNNAAEFYQRCMQFTGPVMAKGDEDTLMYTYNRFLGHNEVGDSVENFGISPHDFHNKMKTRRKDWPLSLNSTSTHDTKRGEDVRARLNVLTDFAPQWFEHVDAWREMNVGVIEKCGAPDANDEYLIYQTLAGAFPMPGEDEDDFQKRLEEYLQKAFREAKRNTSWTAPNEAYETGVTSFVQAILDKESAFWKSFSAFHTEISEYGVINSLSQLLLKFACPGVPDVYQGCDLWDFSMVDPDNRRAVDFVKRQQWLAEFDAYEDPQRLLEKLWQNRNTGQIKLWLTQQLFHLRKNEAAIFSEGDYVPLQTDGIFKDHILAFARIYKQKVLIVAVPLHISDICRKQGTDIFNIDWKDTEIILPHGLNTGWQNLVTGQEITFESLFPSVLFSDFPVAVLKGTRVTNVRSAGILTHITSLASPFGIGDMGPEAYAFADFLAKSHQRIWQLLPLNPTEVSQGNSPYSALSSRAGNPLLISPEILAADGLLDAVNLTDYYLPQNGKTDYTKAGEVKMEILRQAYASYVNQPEVFSTEAFDEFCADNQEWLQDFALYMLLKGKHPDQPWAEWEEPYKLHDDAVLKELADQEPDEIRFIKWMQYIFVRQWKALRAYCNERDIRILGDMPFYVSYNSSDVWANKDFFQIDESGKITGVAGVPPDAFAKEGQLWGMPVFNWPALKAQGYQWWTERLRKNIELFDLVRLDHFRAFADYWVVPGGDTTAINGVWEHGPGADFFDTMKEKLGSLPFVAEDLGKTSPAVFQLRDAFELPGMKVLQYGFDESMPESDHIPHNYTPNFIAYTGTHDNNTIRGWFRKDVDEETLERLQEFLGRSVNEEEVYEVMARLLYSSVAKTVVLPIQDVLNLDESNKMNIPGSNDGNWAWRLLPGQLTRETQNKLKLWTVLYNRD